MAETLPVPKKLVAPLAHEACLANGEGRFCRDRLQAITGQGLHQRRDIADLVLVSASEGQIPRTACWQHRMQIFSKPKREALYLSRRGVKDAAPVLTLQRSLQRSVRIWRFRDYE